MKLFLIGDVENFEFFNLVNAKNEHEALEIYLNEGEIYESFLQMFKENNGYDFHEQFIYNEETQGQIELTKEGVEKNIIKYFKDNEKYKNIYLNWYRNLEEMNFPEDMIRYIFVKEHSSDFPHAFLRAINLSDIHLLIRRRRKNG